MLVVLVVSFARAIVKHSLFCVSYLIFSSNYQEEKDEQGRAKKCKLDSKLLNPSEMIVLFCCHANRHVRNLIIYSIIPVPGYYYDKFFSSFLSLCSHIQGLVFLNLIVYYITFYGDSNTNDSICSSMFFQPLYN